MRNSHCNPCNMARKVTSEENDKLTLQHMKYSEKHWYMCKRESHTVGPEIWRETVEYVKYREIQTILLGFDKKH